MNKRSISLIVVAWLATCAVTYAADTVTVDKKRFLGEIVKTSPQNITIEKNGVEKNVPVNEITSVSFDGEPRSLNIARSAVRNGRYNAALTTLDQIDMGEVNRDLVKQEIEFYKTLCAARLALGGEGKIADAGRVMGGFAKNYPDSYHYYDANEVIGDLLTAMGRYSVAAKFYAKLAQAPWPDYKMRAGVAVGRALLAEGKADDALKCFENTISNAEQGPRAETQRLAAKLGKSRCLAEQGKFDEATSLVQQIIAKADPEETELHARAYNALGTALKKAGKNKEALRAFLHVDVLYFTVSDAHAEALYNLAELWNTLHKAERATRAQQTLSQRYTNSPWANK